MYDAFSMERFKCWCPQDAWGGIFCKAVRIFDAFSVERFAFLAPTVPRSVIPEGPGETWCGSNKTLDLLNLFFVFCFGEVAGEGSVGKG